MAIRNLEAIQRQGTMIAAQQENSRRMREENFWYRVSIIQQSCNDAIDAVDTIESLCKNGLRSKFEDWMKQQNVYYSFQYKRFSVSCEVENSRKESASVGYNPKTNGVHFSWNGYGMCEGYDTAESNMTHFIHNYLGNKGYNKGLTVLSERLQPFLDAFFKWIESI